MNRLIPFLCMLMLLVPSVPVEAQNRAKRKSEGALRKDLRELREKRRALQRELRSTRRQANAVLEDIARVDARLESVSDALEQTTNRLQSSRSEQSRLKVELAEAQKQLAETEVQVRARLRQLYKQGQPTILSVFAGTSNPGDIPARAYLSRRIAEQDKRLFDGYRALTARIAARKQRQDQLVTEVAGLARRQQAQQNDLEDAKDEKSAALNSLRSKQRELQRMIAQFEQDERDIASEIAAFARRTNNGASLNLPLFRGRFIRPVNARITSGYGMRFHPILRRNRLHAGIDFGAPTGTPIRAAADGVVILAQRKGGYGNTVVIEHGGGVQTLYAHCSRMLVGPGARVRQGQVIARVGSTGLSTGPHLHFEIRINGRPVNPMGRI